MNDIRAKGFCFADLDGSLFDSGGKAWGGDRQPVALNVRGEASSFMNAQQRALLQLLSGGEGLQVVPNTARDLASFRRVALPFSGYAILSFGAVILTPPLPGQERGTVMPEPRWHAMVSRSSREAEPQLAAVLSLMGSAVTALGLETSVRLEEMGDLQDLGEMKLRLYANAKETEAGALDKLEAACRPLLPQGWWVHRNGHNLAFLPPYLGKEKAQVWFLENLADQSLAGDNSLTVGLGDSGSDLPFMSACDYVLMPSRSGIFQELLAGTPDKRSDAA
ncbi:MAG: hypothetical protein SFV17_18025 [Candidatus Obscuribacter sp.]|nr:hypothetical protein [Candidatus Obscuribacter sp.]